MVDNAMNTASDFDKRLYDRFKPEAARGGERERIQNLNPLPPIPKPEAANVGLLQKILREVRSNVGSIGQMIGGGDTSNATREFPVSHDTRFFGLRSSAVDKTTEVISGRVEDIEKLQETTPSALSRPIFSFADTSGSSARWTARKTDSFINKKMKMCI
ncbi:unnamed protein product [Microthlaspi erraticum]|uniref:Uncharacterized protein n=1 Tax=Microthlaspi erraticum TaxID=1685480 RepID=A0A6D2JKU3_9BRAS|nr:unnamed protein product [Microthlaspi erraticum]CAA7044289.1 unnamed protein product [Microthlaspi erraticum]